MDDEAPVAENFVEFENSMTRIHQDLGMEIPDWLR